MTDTFYYRVNHESHFFIRTESRFYEIADCRVLTDGEVPDHDGLLPNAKRVSDEKVAELVAKEQERQQHLESGILLRERFPLRQAWSRKAGRSNLRLKKKEVST